MRNQNAISEPTEDRVGITTPMRYEIVDGQFVARKTWHRKHTDLNTAENDRDDKRGAVMGALVILFMIGLLMAYVLAITPLQANP